MIIYGERIRQLRKEAGLNQADLAEKTGVSRPNISFWEKSAFPPLEAIFKVCSALGIDLWEFFVDKKTMAKELSIPEEYVGFFRDMMEFDDETRKDLLEIFSLILQKYSGNRSMRQEQASKAFPRNKSVNYGSDISIPPGQLESSPILSRYLDRLAWIKQ
ncbi:MAG: helix-turn-helix transcriptional regulator [bacterium]|nr:helix-turn-helix transcriptional regulator [bacterium]